MLPLAPCQAQEDLKANLASVMGVSAELLEVIDEAWLIISSDDRLFTLSPIHMTFAAFLAWPSVSMPALIGALLAGGFCGRWQRDCHNGSEEGSVRYAPTVCISGLLPSPRP